MPGWNLLDSTGLLVGASANLVPVTAAADPRPPLDPDRLAALGRGLRVEILAAAPSTNAVVAGRAREGAPHGLVVVAEHQTAGRGRRRTSP